MAGTAGAPSAGLATDKPYFRICFGKEGLRALYQKDPTGFYEWMTDVLKRIGESIPKIAQSKPEIEHKTATLQEEPVQCMDGQCWLQKINGAWNLCCEVWCREGQGPWYLHHIRCDPA